MARTRLAKSARAALRESLVDPQPFPIHALEGNGALLASVPAGEYWVWSVAREEPWVEDVIAAFMRSGRFLSIQKAPLRMPPPLRGASTARSSDARFCPTAFIYAKVAGKDEGGGKIRVRGHARDADQTRQ